MSTGQRTAVADAEAEAFSAALDGLPPDQSTACEAWTVHDVAAHMAGTAAEIIRVVEPYAHGAPVPATRSFEEREAPYRALGHAELARRVVDEHQRMRRLLDHVLRDDPEAVVPWTGRLMAVAKFATHMRNEFAVHRWDLLGDDEVSLRLLSQPELTDHTVSVLGRILLQRGLRRNGRPESLRVRLRTEGRPDVLVSVGQDAESMTMEPALGDRALIGDAAARYLVLWGRRPSDRSRLRVSLTPEELAGLGGVLAGY